jgi:hypothetical protein
MSRSNSLLLLGALASGPKKATVKSVPKKSPPKSSRKGGHKTVTIPKAKQAKPTKPKAQPQRQKPPGPSLRQEHPGLRQYRRGELLRDLQLHKPGDMPVPPYWAADLDDVHT